MFIQRNPRVSPISSTGVVNNRWLNLGLSFVFNGVGRVPLKPNDATVDSSTYLSTTDANGISAIFNGSVSTRTKLDKSVVGTNPSGVTLFALVRTSQVTSNGFILTLSHSTLYPVIGLEQIANAGGTPGWALYCRDDASTTAIVNRSTQLAVGQYAMLVGVFRSGSGSKELYVNSVKVASSTTMLSTITLSKTSVGMLSRDAESTPWTGTISLAGIFNRVLDDSAIKDLSQNPWSIFRDREETAIGGRYLTYLTASSSSNLDNTSGTSSGGILLLGSTVSAINETTGSSLAQNLVSASSTSTSQDITGTLSATASIAGSSAVTLSPLTGSIAGALGPLTVIEIIRRRKVYIEGCENRVLVVDLPRSVKVQGATRRVLIEGIDSLLIAD